MTGSNEFLPCPYGDREFGDLAVPAEYGIHRCIRAGCPARREQEKRGRHPESRAKRVFAHFQTRRDNAWAGTRMRSGAHRPRSGSLKGWPVSQKTDPQTCWPRTLNTERAGRQAENRDGVALMVPQHYDSSRLLTYQQSRPVEYFRKVYSCYDPSHV